DRGDPGGIVCVARRHLREVHRAGPTLATALGPDDGDPLGVDVVDGGRATEWRGLLQEGDDAESLDGLLDLGLVAGGGGRGGRGGPALPPRRRPGAPAGVVLS